MMSGRLGLGLAAVAVYVLLVGVSSVFGQPVPDFEDVPEGHVAESAIGWAAENGITVGVGDNRFGVGETLSRYEMVTFLCRAFDPGHCRSGVRGSDRFDDVPSGHWADYSVGWAANGGITSGVSATEFGGSQTLTREQMITLLYRAEGSPTGGSRGSDVFQDVPDNQSHWANLPIGWAYQQGVTGGIAEGVFGFGTNVSREETVLFLCRTVAPGICPPSQDPLASSVVLPSTTTEEPPLVLPSTTPSLVYPVDMREGRWISAELWAADADGTNQQKLTDDGVQPQWSPDVSRIAFVNPDLDELWVINSDGTNKLRLDDGAHVVGWSPVYGWSPDSTRLAYMTIDHQNDDQRLWVVDVDGTNTREVGSTAHAPFRSGWVYNWSPDGSRIAYRTGFELWVADADGTNRTQLAGDAVDPVWSPDSTKIAYRTDDRLWVVDADGTNQQQLAGPGWSPRWSPDGTRIAYTSDGVWVADADGTNKRQLTKGGGSPRWSPDGTRIDYIGNPYGLWVMNADGTNQQHLTDSPRSGDVGRPRWSPDGSRIAYLHSNRETGPSQDELWVADADGTNKRQLADEASRLVWSPDSTKIAYQHFGLWVVDVDGTNKQHLTDDVSSENFFGFDSLWSPDSTRIAVTFGGELWMMDANGTNRQKIADTWSRPVWRPR